MSTDTTQVGDIVRVRIGFGRPPLAVVSKLYANGKHVQVKFRSARMIEAYGKTVKVELGSVTVVDG
jgi:hypothetical protein